MVIVWIKNVLIKYSPQVKLTVFTCLKKVKLKPCNHSFNRNFYLHISVSLAFQQIWRNDSSCFPKGTKNLWSILIISTHGLNKNSQFYNLLFFLFLKSAGAAVCLPSWLYASCEQRLRVLTFPYYIWKEKTLHITYKPSRLKALLRS